MVASPSPLPATRNNLSVLALSSRFDGRFQYVRTPERPPLFQYSLCRVVLMVIRARCQVPVLEKLSVLALSSRFDGLVDEASRITDRGSFSTRSVESF